MLVFVVIIASWEMKRPYFGLTGKFGCKMICLPKTVLLLICELMIFGPWFNVLLLSKSHQAVKRDTFINS